MKNEIVSLVILGKQLNGASDSSVKASDLDFRDSEVVARHLCEVSRAKDRLTSIKELDDYASALNDLNPRAACFLLDGLQILASEEMMHDVYDGAEFFFAELSESDLLKLVEYTSPHEGEAPSEGHQRWLERFARKM